MVTARLEAASLAVIVGGVSNVLVVEFRCLSLQALCPNY